MKHANVSYPDPSVFLVSNRIHEYKPGMSPDLKDQFKETFFRHAAFFRCNVLTYASLDRFYMALIQVPEPRQLSDNDVVNSLQKFYSPQKFATLQKKWDVCKRKNKEASIQADIERFRQKVYSLPEFMKFFNQSFSKLYNSLLHRNSLVWEGRYQCTAVEDASHAKSLAAAYIDLAPVRERLVSDPKDYQWSGYGNACKACPHARTRLISIFSDGEQSPDWTATSNEYSKLLYPDTFIAEAVVDKLKNNESLLLNEALRCNVKYFDSGLAIGSEEFVSRFLAHNPHLFTRQSRTAKPLLFADWGGLCAGLNPRAPQIHFSA